MRLLRLLRAVLWSFLGVRRGAEATRDLEHARPATLIGVGVLAGATFVLGIVLLVHFVVGERPEMSGTRQAAPAVVPTLQPHGPAVVHDTMAERMRPCTACHGSATDLTRDGFSPRIAGKPAGYLYNQLRAFRDGRRTYAPMAYLVQYMTDDYLREIAAYFAALELPHPPPEPFALPPAVAARARDIVEHGDPARNVPACVECHGATLTGVEPAIPGLRGLPRDYVNAQLGAWRNGRLRALAPDCMAEVARRLAAQDVPALSAWLAAQPVPANAKPAPATDRRLPLECGSATALERGRAAPATPASGTAEVERGRYLVTVGDCIACHTAIGGASFAGGRAIATPFGTVYATNITPDDATGIGTWSREDFRRALHEGRAKDGRLLYPAFPYPSFTQVSDADADAMYAYLRTVAPVHRPATPNTLRFPYGTQAAVAVWRALFFRAGRFVPDPARSDEWNRGAYLVRGLGHCDACHTPRNAFGAVTRSLDLSGGLIPVQNWYAPPLVSRDGTGVAAWDAEAIEALLRGGTAPHATAMGPMAEVVFRSTQHLTPADAGAVAAYLRSFAPSARLARAPAAPRGDPAMRARGEAVYERHCAVCHGSDGAGAYPAYPALRANPGVTEASGANAIHAVVNGGYAPATAAHPRPFGMAPFAHTLTETDIAAVVTYIRGAWGNAAAPVSALDVARFR